MIFVFLGVIVFCIAVVWWWWWWCERDLARSREKSLEKFRAAAAEISKLNSTLRDIERLLK